MLFDWFHPFASETICKAGKYSGDSIADWVGSDHFESRNIRFSLIGVPLLIDTGSFVSEEDCSLQMN